MLKSSGPVGGIAEADGGEFVEHDDVRKMIESRYKAG